MCVLLIVIQKGTFPMMFNEIGRFTVVRYCPEKHKVNLCDALTSVTPLLVQSIGASTKIGTTTNDR